MLRWTFRRDLRITAFATSAPATPPRLRRSSLMTLGVIGATAVAYTLGAQPGLVGDGGFRGPHAPAPSRHPAACRGRIDWSLLLFFCGLFVVVEGLVRSGLPAAAFARYPLSDIGGGIRRPPAPRRRVPDRLERRLQRAVHPRGAGADGDPARPTPRPGNSSPWPRPSRATSPC